MAASGNPHRILGIIFIIAGLALAVLFFALAAWRHDVRKDSGSTTAGGDEWIFLSLGIISLIVAIVGIILIIIGHVKANNENDRLRKENSDLGGTQLDPLSPSYSTFPSSSYQSTTTSTLSPPPSSY